VLNVVSAVNSSVSIGNPRGYPALATPFFAFYDNQATPRPLEARHYDSTWSFAGPTSASVQAGGTNSTHHPTITVGEVHPEDLFAFWCSSTCEDFKRSVISRAAQHAVQRWKVEDAIDRTFDVEREISASLQARMSPEQAAEARATLDYLRTQSVWIPTMKAQFFTQNGTTASFRSAEDKVFLRYEEASLTKAARDMEGVAMRLRLLESRIDSAETVRENQAIAIASSILGALGGGFSTFAFQRWRRGADTKSGKKK
jgi:hypothetical protein